MNLIRKYRKDIMSYILITFGLFMYTFGWSVFMIPRDIIGGGVSGISTIIYHFTGFPIGIMNLIFNGILVAIALRILGAKFGINTIYGILITSVFFLFLQQGIEIDKIIDVSNFDPFMCAIIGSGLAGVGIGLAFSMGGNSGGTDIIALIVNKYYNISPGKVILYIDIFIVGAWGILTQSIENVVYGYVVMGVFAYTLDLVIDGAKQSYQIMVFSNNTGEIAERIGREIGRGVTLLNATGWYSKKDQQVLMVIARKHDKQPIMEIIDHADKKAFISVAKVQGVYGQNFERLKL